MKQKAFFIIFEGLSLKQIKKFFGRWEHYKRGYMINDNENEAENEKLIT